MTMRIHRSATIIAAFLVIAACGKKDQNTNAQTSSGAIAPPTPTTTNGVQVSDVNLGRAIDANKTVANNTTTFGPRDTIYASVHTTGAAQNATVTARWTYQDGQVVNERTESISPSGDAYTEFHISKPSGWPAGNYTLHILLNGQEAQTKTFTVQK
jgi:hypothetical protein